jgi:hypothetical protein
LLGCALHTMTCLLLQPSDWMAVRSPCRSYLRSDECLAVWAEPALQCAGRGVVGNLGYPLNLQNYPDRLCITPDTPQKHTYRAASVKLHNSGDTPMVYDHVTRNTLALTAASVVAALVESWRKHALSAHLKATQAMTGARQSGSTTRN